MFVAVLGTAILMSANCASAASNEAALLIEADTGKVLFAENATVPWYPASVTKVMTTYVTLQAVRNKRITLDSLFTVSSRAALQAPSKMGFKPGSTVTVDNALKMLMVKSANDMAVVLAEGVSGSVEGFSAEMMQASRRLGMTQSNWVNPNGLPADEQISSARDLAILARALIHDFPEYELYWNLHAIQMGKKVMRNYNTLLGRYEGADGMKTGFICASGFNLVASATRNGKKLIAVVLGAKSGPYRGAKAAGLLERGFNRGALSWLTPSLGSVEQLQPVNVAPPDLRDEMCGPHRKRPAAETADDETSEAFSLSSLPAGVKPSSLVKERPGAVKAVAVYLGPAKKSAETQFADARTKVGKARQGQSRHQRSDEPRSAHRPARSNPRVRSRDRGRRDGSCRGQARCGQARGAARAGPSSSSSAGPDSRADAGFADRRHSAARRLCAAAEPAGTHDPHHAGRIRRAQPVADELRAVGREGRRSGAAHRHA